MESHIRQLLEGAFSPVHLEVINESSGHSVPRGSETHFKVVLVAEQFSGKPLLARHRLVSAILAASVTPAIKALSLHTLTPQEWTSRQGQVATSPQCRGG